MKNAIMPGNDEIDLKEIITVLWKRKMIVLIFFIIGIVLAIVVVQKREPLYEVYMVIEPGIMFEEAKEKDAICITIENKIEMRVYQNKEDNNLGSFGVKRPKGANIVKVFLTSPADQIDEAKLRLERLFDAIDNDFSDEAGLRIKTIESSILKMKSEIQGFESSILKEGLEMQHLKELEHEIFDQITSLAQEIDTSSKENTMLAAQNEDKVSAMLYIATLQQKNTYGMVLQEKMFNVKSALLKKESLIEKYENEKANMEKELERLTFELQIKNYFIKQASKPMRSMHSIGVGKQKIIMSGAVLGLLCGILVVLLLHSIQPCANKE